jgi:ADP-dependent phosphofructokinase/glucokinase
LSISDYTAELESVINSSTIASSYNLNIDRKTTDIVFISGRIDFRDGTTLDFKEFIEGSEDTIDKYKKRKNGQVHYLVGRSRRLRLSTTHRVEGE